MPGDGGGSLEGMRVAARENDWLSEATKKVVQYNLGS